MYRHILWIFTFLTLVSQSGYAQAQKCFHGEHPDIQIDWLSHPKQFYISTQSNVSLKASVQIHRGKIDSIRLFHNGKQAKRWLGTLGAMPLKYNLILDSGQHYFCIYVDGKDRKGKDISESAPRLDILFENPKQSGPLDSLDLNEFTPKESVEISLSETLAIIAQKTETTASAKSVSTSSRTRKPTTSSQSSIQKPLIFPEKEDADSIENPIPVQNPNEVQNVESSENFFSQHLYPIIGIVLALIGLIMSYMILKK